MKLIIFDDKILGHHLEYIHHLYDLAVTQQEHQFVFVIPQSFNDVKDKFFWNPSANIEFDYISNIQVCNQKVLFPNSLKKSKAISTLINTYVKKHCADHVFMISIMSLIPACIVRINSKVKISGIIYQIYLHRDKKSSLFVKLLDRVKYILLSKSTLFEKIFILNDKESATKLNRIYRTSRFKFLVDPYIPIEPENINIRKLYNIPKDHKLLIHIGALEERKGTLDILRSILNLPVNQHNKLTFFFAGRVDEEIKQEFYGMINQIKDVDIVVRDEFCSYGFFASLCEAADALLMPYKLDSASSGIIGYASQFKCPVIATSTGLIGMLVKENHLGYLLPSNDADSLSVAYENVIDAKIPKPDNMYCMTHSIEKFQETIATILK